MAQKILCFILISILLVSCSKKPTLIQNPERQADIQRMLAVQKKLTSKSLIPIWDIFNQSLSPDEKQAMETAPLFLKSGAMVNVAGSEIKVSGDLGSILINCLEDSDQMFNNRGEVVKDKYKMDERLSMYNWWMALKALTKDLNKQKKFAETKFIGDINKRAVECSYNYYKVIPENISAKWGLVVFSLVFYVVYTMWYGFAILFMFEGWGLKLEH